MKTVYPTASPLAPGSAKTASPPDAIRVGVGKSLLVEEGDDLPKDAGGKEEDNEIMLGRTLLVEEPVSEDLILLFHHLVSLPKCFLGSCALTIRGHAITATYKRPLASS